MALAARPSSTSPSDGWLTALLWICFLAIAGGNVLSVQRPTVREMALWLIFGAMGCGMLVALLYLGRLLLRRVQFYVSTFFFGALALATTNGIVVYSLDLLASVQNSGGDVLLPGLILTVATLVLLMHGTLAAYASVPYLPAWCSRCRSYPRHEGAVLSDEVLTPHGWLLALYWSAPVLLWLLLLAVLCVASGVIRVPPLVLAGLVVPLIFRVALSLLAQGAALSDYWQMRKSIDREMRRPAAWFLFGTALPLSAALAFYTLCYSAVRVHQARAVVLMNAEYQAAVTELRERHPSKLEPRDDADSHYETASSSLPRVSDYWIFTNRWDSAEAVLLVRKSNSMLTALHEAASRPRWKISDDYGIDEYKLKSGKFSLLNHREMHSTLAIHARLAARRHDWDAMLQDLQTGLACSLHLHQQPNVLFSMIGAAMEDIAVNAIFSEVILHGDEMPDDVMRRAQEIVRAHELKRRNAILHAIASERLVYFRNHARKMSAAPSNFPGCVDLRQLIIDQPVLQLAAREQVRRYDAEIAAAVGSQNPCVGMRGASAKHVSNSSFVSSTLGIHYFSYRTMLVDFYNTATLRMFDLALAVKRYQKLHGRWPENAADCAPKFIPEIPPDPFVPAERLRFEPGPARVFSAGEEGVFKPSTHSNQPTEDYLSGSYCGGGDANCVYLLEPRLKSAEPEACDLKAVFEALAGDDEQAKIESLVQIARAGPLASTTVPRVTRLLNEAGVELKLHCIDALGRIGVTAREALPQLEALSRDDDADVRHMAAEAVRRIKQ